MPCGWIHLLFVRNRTHFFASSSSSSFLFYFIFFLLWINWLLGLARSVFNGKLFRFQVQVHLIEAIGSTWWWVETSLFDLKYEACQWYGNWSILLLLMIFELLKMVSSTQPKVVVVRDGGGIFPSFQHCLWLLPWLRILWRLFDRFCFHCLNRNEHFQLLIWLCCSDCRSYGLVCVTIAAGNLFRQLIPWKEWFSIILIHSHPMTFFFMKFEWINQPSSCMQRRSNRLMDAARKPPNQMIPTTFNKLSIINSLNCHWKINSCWKFMIMWCGYPPFSYPI